MSKLRALGIVLVALFIPLVGASNVSADTEHIVLCQQAELECNYPFIDGFDKAKKPVTEIIGYTPESHPPLLLTALNRVECEASTMRLSVTNELSDQLIGELLSLTFDGCLSGGSSCAVTVTNVGSLSFSKDGPLAAVIELLGGTEINLKCPAQLFNCTYGGNPLLKSYPKGEGKTYQLLLVAEQSLMKLAKPLFCPESLKWDAIYQLGHEGESEGLEPIYLES